MDIKDIAKKADGVKDTAAKAVDGISSNKQVKEQANKLIDNIEKKAKVDLPDVDGIKKMLD